MCQRQSMNAFRLISVVSRLVKKASRRLHVMCGTQMGSVGWAVDQAVGGWDVSV